MDQETFDRIAPNFPGTATLQPVVEQTAKCLKCSGPVRATLLRAEQSGSMTHELDILVQIYCRDARCGESREEWRPWSKSRPKAL